MSLEIITLADSALGSSAQVLPGFGFNCFRFTAIAERRPVEGLWAEDGFETGTKRPSGSTMVMAVGPKPPADGPSRYAAGAGSVSTSSPSRS